jgi:hypothetical protein
MFYLDAAYVTMTIHVCCKCVFQNFQGFHLDVACFYLDVAYVAVAIHICCQCIFYLFQACVASVLSGCYVCYSGYTHML